MCVGVCVCLQMNITFLRNLGNLQQLERRERKKNKTRLINASECIKLWNVACFGKVRIFFQLNLLVHFLSFELQIDWKTHVRRDQHCVTYYIPSHDKVVCVPFFFRQGQSLANDSFHCV